MAQRDDIETHILRVGQGDRQAFAALYAATSAKLFAVALRILQDRGEAEDVLQEVYVKIWHNAGRYHVNGFSPMTWLITVARNASIDRLRKRRRFDVPGVLDERLADPSADPEMLAVEGSERRQIAQCLDELATAHADAVRRAYLDGETYADLAARFDVPLNTMRTWLRRSLLKLRECLSR